VLGDSATLAVASGMPSRWKQIDVIAATSPGPVTRPGRAGLDPGYFTTQPDTREQLFYDPATTNPAVLALDEADKDTTTAAELVDSVSLIAEPPAAGQPSLQINVPVLVVVGADDNIFCDGLTVYNCASPLRCRPADRIEPFMEGMYSPQPTPKASP
jgi:hypothetical protein